MKLANMKLSIILLVLGIGLTSCGTSNTTPAPNASTWNNAKWNDGTWQK